ncbi:L-seryl-tRNA(Sec) selenium transferase [candidate division KSB1 bacterium]|nr:L-seryl-tRNA(Sec) selenium transferase [candidate division KSB1 bacterium]
MTIQDKMQILPSIDTLLLRDEAKELTAQYSRDIVKEKLNDILKDTREQIKNNILNAGLSRENMIKNILNTAKEQLTGEFAPGIRPVINATGVILHTGLGRAPLSRAARKNVNKVMRGYSSLEIDLESGKRGERTAHVGRLLCKLTGAEAAVVVNNNAAAVFLALNTLAFGKEAIISRGQLVEIGGSFRIPEVMEKSGVIMREVGTTNKTKYTDYEKAISPNTGALVVAHTSNYRVVGFTAEVEIRELKKLAQSHRVPILYDLGGGIIVNLEKLGLPYEPLVQDSIRDGADIVTFSGDKVLGGPQCGIIVGKKEYIRKIHANPIMRAVRCDKMTFAALEATLKLYIHPDTLLKNNKTLRMLTESPDSVKARAGKLMKLLSPELRQKYILVIEESYAQTGSGSMPLEKIKSYAITLIDKGKDIEKTAALLRNGNPPVMGYIKNERLFLDLRTVTRKEVSVLAEALNKLV